jgi:transcriptional regulator with XRE-family HTH domain
MKELKDRLLWARTHIKKWSQEKLAEESGVSQGTINNLEVGRSKTARKLASIAAALEVNAIWLENGDGSPMADEKPAKRGAAKDTHAATTLHRCTAEESLMLSLFRDTDDDGRDSLLSIAKRLRSEQAPGQAEK